MKKLSLIALACTICLAAFCQDTSNPGTYMQFFTSQFDKIAKETWDYTNAVARGKGARKIENKRQDLIKALREAELTTKRAKAYKDDVSLRDSLVSYFHLSGIVIGEDYEKIMDMEEIAEQSYDAMEALILARETADEKLNQAGLRMTDQQKRFANAHGIQLTEEVDNLYKKLEKAGEVFDYYNDVYLIFFKSHKQEGYLIDAMNNSDVNGMKQNSSALASISTEGQAKLKAYKAYLSDPQLRMACENILEFHEEEANEKMPVVINFYVQKENFEKIQKSFESKKKSQIKQEDVDAYNAAMEKFNLAVNEYNAINNELNTNRSKLLDAWTEKSAKFLDRHIPK